MTDHAQDIRKGFILRRDPLGRAKNIVRRWWHGKQIHALLIVILYLFASAMDYRDQAEQERIKAERAEQELAIARQYKRAEPVIFVLPANDVGEYEQGLRRVLNAANDQIVHSKAAPK